MDKRRAAHICIAISLAMAITIGCSQTNTPDVVVRQMYVALSEGDTNAYMDNILPDNRKQPGLLGLLSVLIEVLKSLGIDLSPITEVMYNDVKTTLLFQKDNKALVRAEGGLRFLTWQVELHFCDEHDMRLVDGQWYVDTNSPERVERIQRILVLRLKELERWGLQINLMRSVELLLNLCEDGAK